MEILINLVISIAGSLIASAIYDALKNKKNNRPEPQNSDDRSSH